MTQYDISEYEKHVHVVVDVLRSTDGQTIFDALNFAPTENLLAMGNMIEQILKNRSIIECDCENKHLIKRKNK